MNYEQKYKEALKVMESLYNVVKYQSNSDALLTRQTIEKAFHELGSPKMKDERIRKFISRELVCLRAREINDSDRYEELTDAIVWLEKQGEQKTAEWNLPYGKNETAEKLIALAECLEMDGDCLFNELSGNDYGKFLRILARELTEIKPAWSEEDEKMCKETIDWFEKKCFPYALEIENPARESIKWLKSLKDRVQPQLKQEWSEEDKKYIAHIIAVLESWDREHLSSIQSVIPKCIDWLKSLKLNHWKPSDEQLEALEHFVRSIGESGYTSPYDNNTKLIYSLLNDLKKF